jgi:hypothetical protein
MAETTKKATNNAKRVEVRLPRNPGQHANQDEFFSVNGKNYIIKRGETVVIPECVAEVIKNGEKAEEYAMRYVDDLTKAKEDKEKEFSK